MGYVIVTDSVLDIEERFLHQNGICTVPLSFTIDGYDTVEDDFGIQNRIRNNDISHVDGAGTDFRVYQCV